MDDKGISAQSSHFTMKPDDINNYWYQITEKELEEFISQTKKDYENPDNSKRDMIISKEDLKRLSQELDNLRSFVDGHARCVERYKFDKKILQQVQDDWHEYNSSLYTDYCRHKSIMLDSDRIMGEGLKKVKAEAKAEKIKREEIEKRIRDLLSR